MKLKKIYSSLIFFSNFNLDNNQEICDSCDQTVYYPSIYATDPTALGRLAVQQIMPSFLSTNNLANKNENNYHDSNENTNLTNTNLSNSLGALLNANTNTLPTANCMHSNEATTVTDYDFVDKSTKFCTNKNCSSVLTNQLNSNLMNTKVMNVINSNNLQSNGCILSNHTIDNRNSSHVYDIPHRQALQFNKLKQISSTFRDVDQF